MYIHPSDLEGKTVLDYGCGPGNDLVYFSVLTPAAKIIGMDVSQKALNIAKKRLKLHPSSESRAETVLVSDKNSLIST